MEQQQDRTKKYAESLEKNIDSLHHCVKKGVEDFQEMCLMISPERNIPRDMIVDIRQSHKEIRDQLNEINAIQQLLKGKYRQHVRANPTRDKEVAELGFLLKTCYSKFESTLMQIHAKEKSKEAERLKEQDSRVKSGVAALWFQSKENQTLFLEGLRMLKASHPEVPIRSAEEERREGTQRGMVAGGGSLTFFVFKGELPTLDELQSQIQLRERDIIERHGQDELRGVLFHVREVDPSEIEGILQRFMKDERFSSLKCLLARVQSQEKFGPKLVDFIEKNLQEMEEGDVKTLTV
jgi:hypothetical protein